MTTPPKVLDCALEGEPETLDPAAKFSSERANRVKWLLFDALLDVAADDQRLEPALVESWTLSDGGLRAGVAFHDRTVLDAYAVKLCFERQFAMDLNDPRQPALQELLEDLQAETPHTLTFQLKYPGFEYLAQRYLSTLGVVSPIALSKLGRDFAKSPVGTGPFKSPLWLKDRIVLSKNPAYWGGTPKIDQVHFRFIPDGSEAADQLLVGDVDFIPSLSDPDAIHRVLSDERVQVQVIPGYNIYYLGFLCGASPFDNPALRRAVAYGIDVHKAALSGKGAARAAFGPLPPHMQGYDPSVRQASHDRDAAQRLLRECGYDGRPVTLVHFGRASFARSLALAIARGLGEMGLALQRKEMASWPEFLATVRKADGDLFLYSWHTRSDDPQGLLRALFHSSNVGTTNLTGYANPEVDALLNLAPPRDYAVIQRKILEDAPVVFLAHWTHVAAYKTRVRNLRLDLDALPQDRLVGVDLDA